MSQKSDRGQGLLSIVLASHQLLPGQVRPGVPVPDAISLATTQAHSLREPVTTATGVLGRTESQALQDYTSQQPPRAGRTRRLSVSRIGLQCRRLRDAGREDPLEEGTAARSSVLAWRILWTEEPAGCGPWVRKELDTTEGTKRAPAGAGGPARPRSRAPLQSSGPEQEGGRLRAASGRGRGDPRRPPRRVTGISRVPATPACKRGAQASATPAPTRAPHAGSRRGGPAHFRSAGSGPGGHRCRPFSSGRACPLCFWLRLPRPGRGGRGPGGCTTGRTGVGGSLAARRLRSSRPAVRPAPPSRRVQGQTLGFSRALGGGAVGLR